MSVTGAYAALARAAASCAACGACERRCEVLANAPSRTVGELAGLLAETAAGRDLSDASQGAAALAGLAEAARTVEGLAFAVRRCCMCASCTASCPLGIDAREVFCAARELFALAGVTTLAGFESTQVDREWHIFSVYRAVHGIGYSDLPHLEDARECDADALFFPGCALSSYAPDLARAAFASLAGWGVRAVFSEECCGSPLQSGGFAERSLAMRRRIVEDAVAWGIERVICVCPGCRDELASVPAAAQLEFVALPQLLVDAGVRIDAAALAGALQRGSASTRAPRASTAAGDGDARLTFFDSCRDRAGVFGAPLRTMFRDMRTEEMEHAGGRAACCGAGGAASLVDPGICERRAQRVLDDAAALADVVVTDCPTCSYTLAAHLRAQGNAVDAQCPAVLNYLELAYGIPFDWDAVFAQLESMWTGEYGAWVCKQLC